MGMLDRFRPAGGGHPSSGTDIVARYRHLREITRKLNQKMVERLTTDVLREGAGKLGLLSGDTFVFDSEDETSVLMDYCIYDVRRRGRNAVDRYLADSPPPPGSDEMVCLRAMQEAFYGLLLVESVQRGVGVGVRDLLTDEACLLVDIGLSQTARPGGVFASRLLPAERFAMTGGAALPLGQMPQSKREKIASKLSQALVRDADGRFDPAPLIASFLRRGASSRVRYDDPVEGLERRRLSGPGRVSVHVGGEDRRRIAKARGDAPCPCGSGKKYKNCCRKR